MNKIDVKQHTAYVGSSGLKKWWKIEVICKLEIDIRYWNVDMNELPMCKYII